MTGAAPIDFSIRDGSLDEMVALYREIAILEGGSLDVERARNWFAQSDRFLVAVHDGKVIGGVSFSTTGFLGKNMPILDFVNVLRPYYRSGIGTTLCVSAISELVEKGFSSIHCTTLSGESHAFVMALPAASRQYLHVEFSPIR